MMRRWSPEDPVREVWSELSATMRELRRNAGVSLRQAEQGCGRGRGFLSQIENGKARPNRALVEWYDVEFGGHDMLVSLFVEARTAHESTAPSRPVKENIVDGDALTVEHNLIAIGERVDAGEVLDGGWKLRNSGAVDWRGRMLRRVGVVAGPRVLKSARVAPIADCRAGDAVDVGITVTAPEYAGTVVGYWEVVDAAGRSCFSAKELLPVVVVVI